MAHLKPVSLPVPNAVVELTDTKTGELIYCYRAKGETFKAPVYKNGNYTLKAGKDKPTQVLLENVPVTAK